MPNALPQVPTENALQYTLDAQLASGGATVTLNQSVAGVVRAPGYVVIDRVDSSGTSTPSKREYIYFTGVSGTQLTGATRGLAGSSDQVHSVGAIVEIVPDVLYEQDWYNWATAEHDVYGGHSSMPSIATLRVVTNMIASGASLSGVDAIRPVFVYAGNVSGASTIGTPLDMPSSGTIEWVSAVLRSPVSGTSLTIDMYKNGQSIFTLRPGILGGGTFVSTASISTKIFSRGDIFTVSKASAASTGIGNGLDLAVKFSAR